MPLRARAPDLRVIRHPAFAPLNARGGQAVPAATCCARRPACAQKCAAAAGRRFAFAAVRLAVAIARLLEPSRIARHERIRSAEIRNGRLAAPHRGRLADPRRRAATRPTSRRAGTLTAYVLRSAAGTCAHHGRRSLGGARGAGRASRLDGGRRERSRADAVPGASRHAKQPIEEPPYPVLCGEVVRHVGDAIAFIVADDLNSAKSAAELIEVDYEPLPAIADTAGALDAGRAARLAGARQQSRLRIRDRRQGGDRCRLRLGREGRRAHHRQQPARLQLHGAARHRRRIRRGERPLHGDRRLAGRARHARRHVQGAEDRPEDDARAHAGCRRRLRHQGASTTGNIR